MGQELNLRWTLSASPGLQPVSFDLLDTYPRSASGVPGFAPAVKLVLTYLESLTPLYARPIAARRSLERDYVCARSASLARTSTWNSDMAAWKVALLSSPKHFAETSV